MLTDDERFVVDILKRIGIDAEKIPEARSRTADLLASDGDQRYLIEVKMRTDDENLSRQLAQAKILYRSWPVGPTKAVAGILQHAMTQIDATVADELRLVWIRVRSVRQGEYTLAEQVRHTLYGISRVAGSGRGSEAPECYFFHDSIFFRFKELDGAIITFHDKLVLCVNPYSFRANDLKASKLAKPLAECVLDPVELERAGRCLIADCDADRKQPALVLEYLSKKYDIAHPVHFNFDEHAAFARISRNAADTELEIIDEDDIDGIVVVDDE